MKKSIKPILSIFTIIAFIGGMMLFTSCGSSKNSQQVRSGSGMGNKHHKNRHVWGK